MAELAPASEAGQFSLGYAGDTFNTAWYLARIEPEMEVSYFTAIGDDTISESMRGFMTGAGIGDRHIVAVPNRTVGLYLISLDNGERSFSYWRGQSAARLLADDQNALDAAMGDADLVYFSGITLAILAPLARATLLDCLRRAREGGKTIAFDPNLRHRLWADSAEMTEAIMQGAGVSDIALPSFEDEAAWFGDADPEATARRYAGAGVGTVIVKNGSDPVHFRTVAETGTVSVPRVPRVVDTTAAGDSFNAGFLAGFHRDAAIRDCIARANGLAGRVVQGKGALVPIDA